MKLVLEPLQTSELKDDDFLKLQDAFDEAVKALRDEKIQYEKNWLGKPGTEQEGNGWKDGYHTGSLVGHKFGSRIISHLKSLGYTDDNGVISKSGKEIGRIVGARLVAGGNDQLARQVYVPAQPSTKSTEYVLDDYGIYVRRFAFLIRGSYSDRELPQEKNTLTKLKVQNDKMLKKFLPAAPKDGRSPDNRKIVNSLIEEYANECAQTGVMDGPRLYGDFHQLREHRKKWAKQEPIVKHALGLINYAYQGKMGYCLSSSPLRCRDNDGTSFAKTVGHKLWVVDLARVSPSDSVLIKLYAEDGMVDEFVAPGVLKNRELYCSNLPIEAVAPPIALTQEMIEGGHSWKNSHEITLAIKALVERQ